MNIILFFSALLFAQSDSLDEKIKKYQQDLKRHDSLSVTFDQTRRFASRPNRPVKSKGEAYFSRPNYFKWVLLRTGEQWISNGDKIFQVKDNRALAFSFKDTRSHEINDIIDLVMNFDSLQKKYTLSDLKESPGELKVTLTPKSASLDLKNVLVTYDLTQRVIRELSFEFNNQNTSQIVFTSFNFKPLKSDFFQLPKNIKIDDEVKF